MDATSYDEVPYDNYAFSQTHPDRLATVATLLSLSPPPVERCRFLELGCAAGANIIPMAAELPNSTFLGFDLSTRQIEQGQRLVERLGLKNVTLRQANILELDDSLGQFDYIVCHGVYSWVPSVVQDRILEICKRNLTYNGIAYVSYNTYPGWHFRGIIRDVMLYHSKRFPDPRQQAAQARGLIDFLAASCSKETTPYGLFLKSELEVLSKHSDSYILHEHLEECNSPVYFHQFIERATGHGLRYLGEADISVMVPGHFGPEIQQVLQRVASDHVQLEQFMDFLRNRAFRQTLLTHNHQTPVYQIDANRASLFHIASPAVPAGNSADIRTTIPEEFQARNNVTLTSQEPLVKAAMRHLASVWPSTVPFAQLLTAARQALGKPAVGSATGQATDARQLSEAFLTFYTSAPGNLVDFHVRPLPLVNVLSERPRASPLVRIQAETSSLVTNLRHEAVQLDDLNRQLLPLLDGTRDRTALVAALTSLVEKGTLSLSQDRQRVTDRGKIQNLLVEVLQQRLPDLVRLAVLVAPEGA